MPRPENQHVALEALEDSAPAVYCSTVQMLKPVAEYFFNSLLEPRKELVT
jgi:hypothetical protein